jgi:hypothetical protein
MHQSILSFNYKSKPVGYLFIDLVIIAFICFLPALSHLFAFPFYLFEPMRLGLIFCIITTNRTNSILVALSLPFISLLISSHPDFAKSILISAELMINAIIFYYLMQRMNNKFLVMLISIIIAKSIYYTGKLSFLSLGFLEGDLISTPLWIQYIMILAVSIIAQLSLPNKTEEQLK